MITCMQNPTHTHLRGISTIDPRYSHSSIRIHAWNSIFNVVQL